MSINPPSGALLSHTNRLQFVSSPEEANGSSLQGIYKHGVCGQTPS